LPRFGYTNIATHSAGGCCPARVTLSKQKFKALLTVRHPYSYGISNLTVLRHP